MRREQFDEKVKSSLYEVAHQLELAEAKRYLEEDIQDRDEHHEGKDVEPLRHDIQDNRPDDVNLVGSEIS